MVPTIELSPPDAQEGKPVLGAKKGKHGACKTVCPFTTVNKVIDAFTTRISPIHTLLLAETGISISIVAPGANSIFVAVVSKQYLKTLLAIQ
jgi:hypothetical protein